MVCLVVRILKAACQLLDDYEQYKYAELLIDSETSDVGIRFLTEWTPACVAVKRKVTDGKPVAGMTIASKEHMAKLFGETGVAKRSSHRQVVPDATDKTILVLKPAK